jgi:hypothetical protein
MMTPEPTTVSNRRCGFALLIFMAWIDTTVGETRSKRTVRGSVQVAAEAGEAKKMIEASTSHGRMPGDHTPGAYRQR